MNADEIHAQIAPTVTAAMPSRAPRGAPRVVLLGGPAAGDEELGTGMAKRYGVVHVSALQLLKAAASKGTATAKKLMSYTAGEVCAVGVASFINQFI